MINDVPAGTVIRKYHRDREWIVTSLGDGRYELDGVAYASLTAVARFVQADNRRTAGARKFFGLPAYDGPAPARRPTDDEEGGEVASRETFADEVALSALRAELARAVQERDSFAVQVSQHANRVRALEQQLSTASRQIANAATAQRRITDLTAERDEARQERDAIANHLRGLLGTLNQLKSGQYADEFLADLLANASNRTTDVRFTAEGGFRE